MTADPIRGKRQLAVGLVVFTSIVFLFALRDLGDPHANASPMLAWVVILAVVSRNAYRGSVAALRFVTVVTGLMLLAFVFGFMTGAPGDVVSIAIGLAVLAALIVALRWWWRSPHIAAFLAMQRATHGASTKAR